MSELDMRGVDPLRWEEVRRRVAVVKAYLAIPFPTETDRKAHADQLDRSVNQFMALVRAWREHRSAAKVAAAGAHRHAARRPSRLAIDRTAKDEAARIIETIGTDAPLAGIVGAVNARCMALGLKPPSRSTLWNMAVASRKGRGGESGILVATCPVRLPMASEGDITLPTLTLAVRTDDGSVLAAALRNADWETAITDLAAAAAGDATVRADRALLTQKRSASVTASIEPLPGVKARSAMSRILGSGVDDLRLIYQPSKAISPERLLTTKQDSPLSPEDVRLVVTAAVARHNAARKALDAVWLDAV